uniref:Uncharacterized protein n=1 Tax=viral metagenome TaxID=1070528 RepID=A0A6C0K465_9ZZZZ
MNILSTDYVCVVALGGRETLAVLGMLGGGGHWNFKETPVQGTPRLEPRNLFEKRISRDKARLKAYNQILNQIHTRIYHTSQILGNQNYLTYTVPPFVLGLPSLDLEDCIVYVVHMLREAGFVVRYTYPNLLYISWKHYEAEYNRQQNPIVQAMNSKKNAESTSRKGAGGKRGAGDSVQTVTFSPSTSFYPSAPSTSFYPSAAQVPPLQTIGSNQAPARSVADYRAPDALIQSMSRPPLHTAGPPVPAKAGNVVADLWRL